MIKHVGFRFENYGISKFLLYQLEKEAGLNTAALELLESSRLPEILPCSLHEEGEELYLRYGLVSDISLDMMLRGPMSKERLLHCFCGLLGTIIDLQQHGLNSSSLILNKQLIFLDAFSNTFMFIYMPVEKERFEKASLKEFFQDLLLSVVYDEKEDPRFFVSLHNALVQAGNVDLLQLRGKLLELGGGYAEEMQTRFYSPGAVQDVMQGGILPPYSVECRNGQKLEIEEEVQYRRVMRTDWEQEPLVQQTSSRSASFIAPAASCGGISDHEGTTVLGAWSYEEGTITLGTAGSVPEPFLQKTLSNEKIVLTKEAFKIGRDPEQTDYTSRNKVVGRVHAEILMVDGEYFLRDNHSRNGSSVNGVRLLPGDQIKIKHEDKIKLANEEFVFKLFDTEKR